MTIAFDIDGTWSLDPRSFVHVAATFGRAGWTVIIVTGSHQPKEKLDRLFIPAYPIIVSGSLMKEEAARRAGYKVDVWVDDMPGMIQNCKVLQGMEGEP